MIVHNDYKIIQKSKYTWTLQCKCSWGYVDLFTSSKLDCENALKNYDPTYIIGGEK